MTWKGSRPGNLLCDWRDRAVLGGDVKRVCSFGRGVKVVGFEGDSITQLYFAVSDCYRKTPT